ncbi:DUF1700 domain-containing protein [Baia soyae]|uniref:Putative membrane protein n=1 Tax=Baia soyae TaxID=1544746 RepID=A0A4R2RSR6_9BACL|nr:DUF1700 domain-containing protein [Baia soyae]TCP67322.1 putative membrane protein [Baia soyae]
MTKMEFLNELRSYLHKLPVSDQEDILSDYETHFEHGLGKGKTESEVIQSLGKPKLIAKECLADYYIEEERPERPSSRRFRSTYMLIGLGLFNLIFLVGPFIAFIAVVFSFYVTAIILCMIPLVALASFFIVEPIEGVFSLFVSFICLGIGLLMWTGLNRFSKVVYQWFIRYIKSNYKIIKGEAR